MVSILGGAPAAPAGAEKSASGSKAGAQRAPESERTGSFGAVLAEEAAGKSASELAQSQSAGASQASGNQRQHSGKSLPSQDGSEGVGQAMAVVPELPQDTLQETAGELLQTFPAEPLVAEPSGAAGPTGDASGLPINSPLDPVAPSAMTSAADEITAVAGAAPLIMQAPATAQVPAPAINSAAPAVVDSPAHNGAIPALEVQPGLDSDAALLAGGGQNVSDAVESAELAPSRLTAAASQPAMPAQNALRPLAGEAPVPRSETLSVPVGHTGWGDELAGKVNLLVRNGVSEARLQLNPAGLGHLAIDIQTDGDKAVVVFHAQHGATRDAIEQAMPRLREMFEQSGLQLAHGSVSDQSQSGQRSGGQASDSLAATGAQGADGQESGLAEASVYLPASAMASALVDYYA